MKNSQSIRKILFLSESKIALVVFDVIENQKNILFAKQVNLSGGELKVRINELLTQAANFLGFNIKEVEIVFDDSDVKKFTYKDELPDCNNEEEITKGIYKNAKLRDHYVNEIAFNNIIYDDIEKKAIVDYEIIASVYTTYSNFIKAARQCNLVILNSTNIYTLINSKNIEKQMIIKMFDGFVTISEYSMSKLNNVYNFDLSMDEVYIALANKFGKTVDAIKQMINIVNSIDADINTETLVSLNFDFIHKKFNGIKANELIEAYQAEINYLLSCKFDLNNYTEINMISNQIINNLPNTKSVNFDEIIGLEKIDLDKILALSNIDINGKDNTQFKFENTINSKVNAIVA